MEDKKIHSRTHGADGTVWHRILGTADRARKAEDELRESRETSQIHTAFGSIF